ncbi:hypothetical protein [Planctomicrobium sp. SH664]|uniref:hypothetical protein n=1 Tax=Planctomicrobium sp. SH664 TaxID=3448125 RepID=UPI003F5C7403
MSHSWGFDQLQAPPVGLGGLFNGPPAGLGEEDFAALTESIDGSWKEWTTETGTFVKDLFTGEHATVDEQRASIQRVKVKLNTLEKALSDPRYKKVAPQLSSLYSKLSPAVETAEALLDTLTVDPAAAQKSRVEPAFNELHSAVRKLQSDLKSYGNGSRWNPWIGSDELLSLKADNPQALEIVTAAKAKLEKRETYSPEVRDFVSREPFLALEDALATVQRALQPAAPTSPEELRGLLTKLLETIGQYNADPNWQLEGEIRSLLTQVQDKSPDGGAELSRVIGAAYLNYNLRLGVSEGLMNRFYMERRVESSTIRDRVMEACVVGNQCTNTDLTLDILPSSQNARFAITLSGVVRANTNGYTDQATIHTVGNHSFRAQKPIIFDGQSFYGEPAQVSVRANNQTVGASTKFSGLPLFGRIADNIAFREASSRTPQANAMAAGKISNEVRQKLNDEADRQFANASKELQTKTYGPLRKYDLYPDVIAVNSTDKELRFWSRLLGPTEVAGSRPAPMPPVPSNGLVAQIHESLLTHGLDRFGLAGQTMTEDEVRSLLESRFSEILNREVKFPEPQPTAEGEAVKGNTLVFDEHDAVRFIIRGGEVILQIRAGLKRDNGDDIPTQIITVPFTPVLTGNELILKRGNVGVKPVSRPPNVGAQITRANVMRQKIQAALPERTLENKFVVNQNGKTVNLSMTGLSADAGWLTITLQ